MAVDAAGTGSSLRGARLSLSATFWKRPWLKLAALLSPPVAAFLLVYIAALVALLISSLWSVDSFTGKVVHTWSLGNFKQIFSFAEPTYLRIAGRTIGIAAAVTVTDAIIAFPFAFFMARIASPRMRAALFILVLLPLWSSYLVRIYSWRTILSTNGAINWVLNGLGLPDQHIAYTNWAMWIVFSYVWLPFMILPVVAAIERIPESYLEASRDLGGRGFRTLRSVIVPLALPGIVAGSIFTFALTLGDFIMPVLIGGTDSTLIGLTVEDNSGGNLPFAAAFATLPVVVMGVYLGLAKRLGAFEAL